MKPTTNDSIDDISHDDGDTPPRDIRGRRLSLPIPKQIQFSTVPRPFKDRRRLSEYPVVKNLGQRRPSYHLEINGSNEFRWPSNFYEQSDPDPLDYDGVLAGNFIDLDLGDVSDEERDFDTFSEDWKVEHCSEKYKFTLLDLPNHILENILKYLCCDEPSNRRNRNVRNFMAAYPQLKNLVCHSCVPDYLELGINILEPSNEVIYAKFLQQVNWRIKTLRLVVIMRLDHFNRSKKNPLYDLYIRPAVMSSMGSALIDLKKLILDFSDFNTEWEFEDLNEFITIKFSLEHFYEKLPKLETFQFAPLLDAEQSYSVCIFFDGKAISDGLSYQYRYDIEVGESKNPWYNPLSLRNLHLAARMDGYKYESYFLSCSDIEHLEKFECLTHLSLGVIFCEKLSTLSSLRHLSTITCFRIDFSNVDFTNLNSVSYNKLVSVTHLIIRDAFHFRVQSLTLWCLFPNLRTYETLFRPMEANYFESLRVEGSEAYQSLHAVVERMKWWNFHNLTSVSIFIRDSKFSEHLVSLRNLCCLKNLCLKFWRMFSEQRTEVVKMLSPKTGGASKFFLELFRLETERPYDDYEDIFVHELVFGLLDIATLQVCMIATYHENNNMPTRVAHAVMRHASLVLFQYQKEFLRMPDKSCVLGDEKLRWCRPRLYISEL